MNMFILFQSKFQEITTHRDCALWQKLQLRGQRIVTNLEEVPEQTMQC